jgi:hypothetical protein
VLEAGKLKANGDRLRIHASGTATNSSNAKTIRFVFGGTTITLIAAGSGTWTSCDFTATVIRKAASGAGAQKIYGILTTNNAAGLTHVEAAAAEDMSTDVTLKTRLYAVAGTLTETDFSVDLYRAP